MFAFTLMALVALAFAAIALGLDSKAANNLQNAADSAALAGATAFVAANSPRAEDRLAEAQASARATAAGNAEFALTDFDVSAVTEDAYGQHTEIEVSLAFQPANVAASVLGRNANIALTRSALASATWGFPLCILSLETTNAGVSTDGNANLSAKNCVIWSNSKGSKSLSFSGGDAEAKFFCAAGKAPVTGGTQINPRPTENCDPIPDPLKSWIPPAPESNPVAIAGYEPQQFDKVLGVLSKVVNKLIDQTVAQTGKDRDTIIAEVEGIMPGLLDADGRFKAGPAKGMTLRELLQIAGYIDYVDPADYVDDTYYNSPTYTLSPGTYTGLDIAEGHVRMQPGVYHFVDGPLIVRRRATLSGEGVTIVLHGPKATFSVLDEARLTLHAPADGPTAGFAIAEDRYDSYSSKDEPRSRLTGFGVVDAIGTIYVPRHQLSITGDGAAQQTSPLLQIVARQIDVGEHGALAIDFAPDKTKIPVSIKPAREARLLR